MSPAVPLRSRECRRFFLRLLAFLVCFTLLNGLIWQLWTESILSPRFPGGDLTRLGYVSGIKKPRDHRIDLPARHLEMRDYRGGAVDMITVGDSFSIGGGGGKNCFYQDYIASTSGINVLNVPSYKFDTMIGGLMPVATLDLLLRSGYIDKFHPRYVLLESVERYTVARLNHRAPDGNEKYENVEHYYRNITEPPPINQGITFINEGNFKFLYYNLMYHFSDHAFRKRVIRTQLKRPLFSGPRGGLLLVHGDDLQQMPLATPESIRQANERLNLLAQELRRKGAELIFMPVVDKLDLYRPYMRDERYPHSRFFEELRSLPRDYRLIDTKAILAQALAEGELDLFHQDDTHWTWKAAERIFSRERFGAAAR